MLKVFRIYTLLLCALVAIIGCSDNAINNAVAPATNTTEKITPKADNTLRITRYEKGPFEIRERGPEGDWQHIDGIYVGEYQGKKVWLYGFFHGDLIVGTTIEEPQIIDDWIQKVTIAKTQKTRTVRFLEIEPPAQR